MPLPVVAKYVIIVTSGRATYASGGALDQLIRECVNLGKKPIVVLGPDGDDLLRVSTLIEECEMVFDPNFNGGIFSSVQAGLAATDGAAFVMPLGAESFIEPARWPEIERTLLEENNKRHVVRPVQRPSQDSIADTHDNFLYPLMVTPQGLLPLKALPSYTDWLNSERIQVSDFTLP